MPESEFVEIVPTAEIRGNSRRAWVVEILDAGAIIQNRREALLYLARSMRVNIEVIDGGFFWKYPKKPDILFFRTKVYAKMGDIESQPHEVDIAGARAISILHCNEFLFAKKACFPIAEQ